MSIEEAIEDLKSEIKSDEEELPYSKEILERNKILLNRLEQLEKENEELKSTLKCTQDSWFEDTKKIEELNAYIKKLDELNTKDFIFKHELENYIPKSVIREKIYKLKREFDFYAGREHAEWQDGEFDGEVCDDLALKIGVLKELLGEEK